MTKTTHYTHNIEFPMSAVHETKAFYSDVFGWEFTDWGDGYISFVGDGIEGGFNGLGELKPAAPGVLVVLYVTNVRAVHAKISGLGLKIVQPIYGFPGGERFHFCDPNGNELACWSEVLENE